MDYPVCFYRWIKSIGWPGLLSLLTLSAGFAQGQNGPELPGDRDIIDVMTEVVPRFHPKNRDSLALQHRQTFLWVIPLVGYSPQTGFLAGGTANATYRRPGANFSSAAANISYTQHNQLLFTVLTNLWSSDNRYLFQGDYRIMHYPQSTYGLGMFTNADNPIQTDYEYLRLYQNVLKRVAPSLYVGVGYALDLHWNIEARNSRRELTRISRYPYGINGRSVSSGPSLNLLYDNRANSITPDAGVYANVVLRANPTWLGTTTASSMLLVDFRKYIQPGGPGRNVLALWSYNSLVLTGDPPFLDLPSTGWDTYSNVGRGHIQGRFRGKQFLYTETEYRFAITRDRFLGGVVFANAQTVSEYNRQPYFERVVGAAGLGIRLRMNKVSRANLGVDYGYGFDGSHGLYFNFGEVF